MKKFICSVAAVTLLLSISPIVHAQDNSDIVDLNDLVIDDFSDVVEPNVDTTGNLDPNQLDGVLQDFSSTSFGLPDVVEKNTLEVMQEAGTDNTATIEQVAGATDPNFLLLQQTSEATNSTATITQNGSGNIGVVVQSGNQGDVTVTMGGEGNKLGLRQAGVGNKVDFTTTDTAKGNEAYILQQGQSNTLTLTQSSQDSVMKILQDGTGNSLEVTQTE